MQLEECITELFSYHKISKELHVAFSSAKKLVAEYFDNDKFEIHKYQNRYKEKYRKTLSEKTTGVRKGKKKDIRESIQSLSLFCDIDLSKYNEYLSFLCDLEKTGLFSNFSRYTTIYKFIRTQFLYYSDDDSLIDGFNSWVNSGFKWNSMDINSWITRYGKINGELLFNERLEKCNVLKNKSSEYIQNFCDKISSGVNAYYANTTVEDRRKNSWQCIEFWLDRGYSIDDARDTLKNKLEQTRNTTNWGNGKVSSENTLPENRNTNFEYWLKKFDGNIDVSLKEYKNRQRTFTLEKCIKKYGVEIGNKVWENRQLKWIDTLNNKSNIEKEEILLKKTVKKSTASKTSMIFFENLLPSIYEIIDKDLIFIGIEDKQEYFLRNPYEISGNKNRIFFYDFCIPSLKIIVEFHGLCFHYDFVENAIPNNFLSLNEEDIKKKDILKETIAKYYGYEYLVVWENKEKDYKDDINRIMGRIRSAHQRNSGIIK